MHFELTTKKIFYIFILFTAFLLTFDLASYFYLFTENQLFLKYYDKYFNMEYERNVPTFFSFSISFLTGLTAFMIHKEKKKIGWLVVAFFFTYLAFDDALSLHEYIGSYLGEEFFKHSTNSYYWQITYVPLFSILGLYIFVFLFNQYKEASCKKCIIFIFIGFGSYALAVGLDYYEGLDPDFSYIMNRTDYFSYRDITHILRSVEEAIEMFGATLILSAISWVHALKIKIS